MLYTTEPVEVLAVGQYDESNPNFGEFVRVKAEGEESSRRYTLDKALNGGRPKVGSRVVLKLVSSMQPKPYTRRDGELANRWVEKFKVIDAQAA